MHTFYQEACAPQAWQVDDEPVPRIPSWRLHYSEALLQRGTDAHNSIAALLLDKLGTQAFEIQALDVFCRTSAHLSKHSHTFEIVLSDDPLQLTRCSSLSRNTGGGVSARGSICGLWSRGGGMYFGRPCPVCEYVCDDSHLSSVCKLLRHDTGWVTQCILTTLDHSCKNKSCDMMLCRTTFDCVTWMIGRD